MKGGNSVAYLDVSDLRKSFGDGNAKVNVLNGISMEVDEGQMCAVLGQSGSGKSTLLNIIGGLDKQDSGKITVDGRDISNYGNKELSEYRRECLGFIFQFYNLVPNLTVLENIQVGEYLSSSPLDINEILHILGLSELKNRFPGELSGGQQQRCSIGRALIKNPKLLLCDEPTGALDYNTSKDILGLIEQVNKKYNTTIIMVTHNQTISEMMHKTIFLKDGTVIKTRINKNPAAASELEW